MIHHFNCPWVARHISFPLIFDWDDETGEVTGPGADLVMRIFKGGIVRAHPMPWSWDLTSTKSQTDIAAVIGSGWILPEELADDYPRCPEPSDDFILRDPDGNIIPVRRVY